MNRPVNSADQPSSSNRSNDENNPENAPTSPVFAVYFPEDMKNSPRVFYQSLKDATKFANSPEGKSKGARFRRFENSSEASKFYESGEPPRAIAENTATAADPVVAFSSVSRIEMNKLKKIIETDNLAEFLVLALDNPRYLINTSGDTAAIVQEGFRFNALHIAARQGSALIAEHILKLASDTDYLVRLYSTNESDVAFRKENILNSYLNTPDKGNGDTPLHIAAKWGHVEVLRIISSYRQAVRILKNKNNESPFDTICSRYNGDNKGELANQMRTVLNSYYVAMYRCSDHSLPTRWAISSHYPHSSMSPSSSTSLDSPFSPILASFHLTGVAGPFGDEEIAVAFQKKWKTEGLDRRRRDFDRGAEKVGREMASNDGTNWAELWPFHADPIDLRKDDGLKIMEKYLKSKLENESEENEENEELYEDAQEEWIENVSAADESISSMMGKLTLTDRSLVAPEEKESDDDSSLDGFVTPPSSPPPLFLNGYPSKVDSDLFEVLETLDESALAQYPLIKRFLLSVLELENRATLPSHTSPRYRQNSRSRITKPVHGRNILLELNDL